MTTLKDPITSLSQERVIATPEFIANNSLALRPVDEIFARLEKERVSNILNFVPEVLYDFLPFEKVKAFFRSEYVTEVEAGTETWNQVTTIEEAAQDFVDYMNFAWGKAEDERGISASRSVSKLGAWLWAMSRPDLEKVINDSGLYAPYGAPALISVCDTMGITVPESLREFAGN